MAGGTELPGHRVGCTLMSCTALHTMQSTGCSEFRIDVTSMVTRGKSVLYQFSRHFTLRHETHWEAPELLSGIILSSALALHCLQGRKLSTQTHIGCQQQRRYLQKSFPLPLPSWKQMRVQGEAAGCCIWRGAALQR